MCVRFGNRRFFKQLSAQKLEVIDLITNALPEISNRIDINSLELDNNSYINKGMDVNLSDKEINLIRKEIERNSN